MILNRNYKLLFALFLGAGLFAFTQVRVIAAPGDLDVTFSGDGKIQTAALNHIYGTVVQPDGKVVVAGYKARNYPYNGSAAVARFNADGSLDLTFGTEGVTALSTDAYDGSTFRSIVLQSDGKLVAVGADSFLNVNNGDSLVVRLNADGSFDTTFAGDGIRILTFTPVYPDCSASEMTSVRLVPGSSDIVVAGYVGCGSAPIPYTNDIAVARLNADGTLDNAFGTAGTGKRVLDLGYSEYVGAMAIHPLSKKIALSTGSLDDSFTIVMLTENGSYDTNFGGIGVVTTSFGEESARADSLAFQYIGNRGLTYRLVAGGFAGEPGDRGFAMARYKMDGTLDTSFSTDGKVKLNLSYQHDYITALHIDADRKIVAAGPRKWNGTYDFAAVRFTPDGALDTGFGIQGKVITQFFYQGDHLSAMPNSVDLAPDGKIVVAGSGSDGGLLARYEP